LPRTREGTSKGDCEGYYPLTQATSPLPLTVTLEQVKAVALTVKTLGGSVRLYGLLALIKEVGGLKKFKDLLDAMSVPEEETVLL